MLMTDVGDKMCGFYFCDGAIFRKSSMNLKKSYNNNSFCQVQIDLGNELILFKTLLTCCDNLTENHIIGNNSN